MNGALFSCLALSSILMITASGFAQQPASAQRLEFDVASVRQNKMEGKPSSNIALGPGDVQGPSGGVLSTKNFTLLKYIEFAYKLTDYQEQALRAKLPDWAMSDRYNIEARTTDHSVTKDEMRCMMQSLLADRFKLAVHYEPRAVSLYALVLVASGKTGPKLRAHPSDSTCPDFSLLSKTAGGKAAVELPDVADNGFPTFCGGILGVPANAQDRYSFGARNVAMSAIANALSSWGNLGRPVVDKTGLAGKWDFVLNYTPDPRPAYATVDSGGPTFQQALQKQLGLKLESQRGQVRFLVVDHIDHVNEN
jgi:uncharacterized protein (TIGR03435 family)